VCGCDHQTSFDGCGLVCDHQNKFDGCEYLNALDWAIFLAELGLRITPGHESSPTAF
jgi:hypothetical protein